eukprot:77506-Pelagomonas_calceolata.AAC.3
MLYTVLISLTWLVSLPCPIKAVTYSVSEAPRLACKMPGPALQKSILSKLGQDEFIHTSQKFASRKLLCGFFQPCSQPTQVDRV